MFSGGQVSKIIPTADISRYKPDISLNAPFPRIFCIFVYDVTMRGSHVMNGCNNCCIINIDLDRNTFEMRNQNFPKNILLPKSL